VGQHLFYGRVVLRHERLAHVVGGQVLLDSVDAADEVDAYRTLHLFTHGIQPGLGDHDVNFAWWLMSWAAWGHLTAESTARYHGQAGLIRLPWLRQCPSRARVAGY